jgi:hypothetical protein
MPHLIGVIKTHPGSLLSDLQNIMLDEISQGDVIYEG